MATGFLAGLLKSSLVTEAGFRHAFPERAATEGAIALELGLASDDAHLAIRAIARAKQVHGRDVLEVVDATDAIGKEADALVARAGARSAAVGVRVADCVPVVVADAASGDVAVIHAGWRGVAQGVVPAAVERLGGRDLVAAIGPCIGPCCFEVGRDVAEQIAFAAPGARVVAAEKGEKVYVDLRVAVRAQLAASGVRLARIDDVPGCTKHETARFHSFRRDGAHSGRMLAWIATPRPP